MVVSIKLGLTKENVLPPGLHTCTLSSCVIYHSLSLSYSACPYLVWPARPILYAFYIHVAPVISFDKNFTCG